MGTESIENPKISHPAFQFCRLDSMPACAFRLQLPLFSKGLILLVELTRIERATS